LNQPQGVAAQVDPCESKGLKPGFHMIGPTVETRRLQAIAKKLCQTLPKSFLPKTFANTFCQKPLPKT
jgi:hypothetical protein